jgi:hypothetical protein
MGQVSAQVKEEQADREPDSAEHVGIRLREALLRQFGQHGLNDVNGLLDFRLKVFPRYSSSGELALAIADVRRTAEHGPDEVLEIAARVKCQSADRVRDAGEGFPDLLFVGEEFEFRCEAPEFAAEKESDPFT